MALYNVSTIEEFEEKVIKSDVPVLVDFWADWCPPCKAMAPILDGVASVLKDEAHIVKIDVESGQEAASLAAKYGVRGIPNMQLFRNGEVAENFVGITSSQVLIDALKK